MNDQMQDLARRAVACKHWRWMPGMKLISTISLPPGRVTDNGCVAHGGKAGLIICKDDLPDLIDPATLGCLVALVREAWDSPMLNTVQERGIGWIVADSLCCSMLADDRYYRGQTEAEALVAALEAAP